MSRKMKSIGQRAFQDESATYGIRTKIASPQSSTSRQSSSPRSSMGSTSTHPVQPSGTPIRSLAPSIRFTLLDEKASQNRDPAYSVDWMSRNDNSDNKDGEDKLPTVRGRTMLHPNRFMRDGLGRRKTAKGPQAFSNPSAQCGHALYPLVNLNPWDLSPLPLPPSRQKIYFRSLYQLHTQEEGRV